MTARFSHRAMATRFDLWLVGDDEVQLRSLADMAWAEVDRIELLLSRHDDRAEVARINRDAHHRPVKIELELFNVLQDCLQWAVFTFGYFDITLGSTTSGIDEGYKSIQLDPDASTIYLAETKASIDLGGYGKGYALDKVIEKLERYEIKSAFLQSGNSSALSIGVQEHGIPWQIGMYDDVSRSTERWMLPLVNQGFSYSATYHQAGDVKSDIQPESCSPSDVVNPLTGQPLLEQAACWLVAPSALRAEVLTTALLAMGQAEALRFFEDINQKDMKMGWLI